MSTTTKNTFRENVLRVIAVLGLIAVLLLGAWGIIQLAFVLPGFFSNIGSSIGKTSAKETLSLSVPTAVLSERAFPVAWTHKNGSGEYSYAISYACQEGVTLKAPLPTGAGQDVKCNTSFNYLNATTTTLVILTLAGDKTTPVTFTVTATKLSTGAVAATATSTTSLNPIAKSTTTTTTTKKPTTTTTTKSTPTTKYVSASRTATLYGYSDLAVRITGNPGTVRNGQRVALQFTIENVGTNVTPTNWTFTASLPYNPVYTYQSGPQQALYPGDKIVYTLGYDAYAQGTTYPSYGTVQYDPTYSGWSSTATCYGDPACGAYNPNYGYGYTQPYGTIQTVSVQVDPMGYIYELTKNNNFASISYNVY